MKQSGEATKSAQVCACIGLATSGKGSGAREAFFQIKAL
jgi:hypothetical protein